MTCPAADGPGGCPSCAKRRGRAVVHCLLRCVFCLSLLVAYAALLAWGKS